MYWVQFQQSRGTECVQQLKCFCAEINNWITAETQCVCVCVCVEAVLLTEDDMCDDEGEDEYGEEGERQDEQVEEAVVPPSDAVSHPGTVMVKTLWGRNITNFIQKEQDIKNQLKQNKHSSSLKTFTSNTNLCFCVIVKRCSSHSYSTTRKFCGKGFYL